MQNAVQFRKGFFLGDGTGSGKGRQAAGIILDNWLRGRRKAVWISKSDKLIEDAQRDWSALGQEKLLIVPQSRYRQGTPIRIAEGILFTTYATLRSSEREGKDSRLKQILDWLGTEFRRRDPVRRSPRHGQCRRREKRTRRQGALAARPRRTPPAARAAECARRLCLGDGRDRACIILPMRSVSASGAERIFRLPTGRILSRRSRPAASPPWKCWRAI